MIFWVLVALVFVLAGQLTVALWVVYRLNRKLAEVKKREQRVADSLDKKEVEVVALALEKGRKIIAKAIREATKIEGAAAANRQELEQLFDQRLRQELEKVQKNDINIFRSISKDIERDAYQVMLAEVEKEKEVRLKKLDGQITALVEAVAEKVLGRALSLETHEELIFAALAKAKKEGMLR